MFCHIINKKPTNNHHQYDYRDFFRVLMYRHIINMNPIENHHQCGAWLYGFLYFWTLRMPCHKIDRDVAFFVSSLLFYQLTFSTIYFPETYILDTLMHYFVWTSNKRFLSEFLPQKQLYIFQKPMKHIEVEVPHVFLVCQQNQHIFHHFYLQPALRGSPRHETQRGPRIREISF